MKGSSRSDAKGTAPSQVLPTQQSRGNEFKRRDPKNTNNEDADPVIKDQELKKKYAKIPEDNFWKEKLVPKLKTSTLARQTPKPGGLIRELQPPLLVSTRAKDFKRPSPQNAGPRDRNKAYRILKRKATVPITEDQVSKEDYAKIQEDIAWAQEVIPNFDINLPPEKDNKQESSMEESPSATKKARFTSETISARSTAEVANGRKVIAVIDRNHTLGTIPRNQWKLVKIALAKVAVQVLEENP